MSAQTIDVVADVMALATEFTRLKIDRASWGIGADAQTNAARVGIENYLIGVVGGITRLETENAAHLARIAQLESQLAKEAGLESALGEILAALNGFACADDKSKGGWAGYQNGDGIECGAALDAAILAAEKVLQDKEAE